MNWHPVRAVARQLLRSYGGIFVSFWLLLVGGTFFFRTTLLMGINSPGASAWRWFAVTPPKWFLFVLAIITAGVYLQVFIGHGITRRNIVLGVGVVFGIGALASGLAVVAGFGVERIVFAATDRLTEAHPTASLAGIGVIALTVVLQYAAFSLSGWLVGAGFYRFGAWGGIAFIVPALLPAALAEVVFERGTLGDGERNLLRLGDLALTGASAVSLAVTALGALAAYQVVRTVPVRKVSS
jgi:hypothetical protein